MLLQRNGNIFEYEHEAYAQGVSNTGKMGSGIATEFKKRYPLMFEQYKELCRKKELKPGDCFFYEKRNEFPAVFNLVTQDNLLCASISYLENSIEKMHHIALDRKIYDIAIPKIGCSLGNLKLDELIRSLRPFTRDSRHHITIYSL
jgi:O-acetyl-ADP-ribose deacetylase (regulator of RNase III)